MNEPEPPVGPRPTPRARPEPRDARPEPGPKAEPSIWVDESVAEPAPASVPRSPSSRTRRSGARWRVLAGFVVGALAGAGLVAATGSDEPGQVQSEAPGTQSTTTTASNSTPETSAATPPSSSIAPPTETSPPATAPPTGGAGDPVALAAALGPIQLPSDCPLPLNVPESLPNAARDYRGGVHEGIDFICGEYGRDAVAALDGQVVVANDSFVDPTPAERSEILATAKALGRTPPWTLAMLFGRFVAIDHGIRAGVGHVVTIYAHLNAIDPAIKPGHRVKAGERVGEIGKAGTESAGTGETRPQAIHLHWEIHIDEQFLGQGRSAAETSAIYAELFGR